MRWRRSKPTHYKDTPEYTAEEAARRERIATVSRTDSSYLAALRLHSKIVPTETLDEMVAAAEAESRRTRCCKTATLLLRDDLQTRIREVVSGRVDAIYHDYPKTNFFGLQKFVVESLYWGNLLRIDIKGTSEESLRAIRASVAQLLREFGCKQEKEGK